MYEALSEAAARSIHFLGPQATGTSSLRPHTLEASSLRPHALEAAARSIHLLGPDATGTLFTAHFTGFTCTKVQILTDEERSISQHPRRAPRLSVSVLLYK